MNILYIEDNELDKKAFARLCERWEDICCWQSHELGQAIQLAERYSIDVIFTDYFLEDFSAIEVKKVFTQQLIVLLTGINDDNLIRSIQDARVPFVLPKPPKAQLIRDTLDKLHFMRKNVVQDRQGTPKLSVQENLIDFSTIKQLAKGDICRELMLLNSFVSLASQSVAILQNYQDECLRTSLIYDIQSIQQHLNLLQLKDLLDQAQTIEIHCRQQKEMPAIRVSLQKFISQLQQTIEVVKQEILKRQFV